MLILTFLYHKNLCFFKSPFMYMHMPSCLHKTMLITEFLLVTQYCCRVKKKKKKRPVKSPLLEGLTPICLSYYINTTKCNVVYLLNIYLKKKCPLSISVSQAGLSSSVRQCAPAILITATVGSSAGLDADTVQSALFGHGCSSQPRHFHQTAIHSFFPTLSQIHSTFLYDSTIKKQTNLSLKSLLSSARGRQALNVSS